MAKCRTRKATNRLVNSMDSVDGGQRGNGLLNRDGCWLMGMRRLKMGQEG